MVRGLHPRSGMSRALLIVLVVILGGGAFALVFLWPAANDDPPDFPPLVVDDVLRDEFEGSDAIVWDIIRENPDNVSLTKHPGELTIMTEMGSMWQAEDPQVNLPKNLHVVPNPARPDEDWQLTTQLIGFQPVGPFHQAGLLVYQDDDNYIKLVVQFNSTATRALGFSSERNAEAKANRSDIDPAQPDVWLRIIHRGDVYQALTSYDGENYEPRGEITWDGDASRIGLLAKQGGNPAPPSIDARFGFFELQKLPKDATDANDNSGDNNTAEGGAD